MEAVGIGGVGIGIRHRCQTIVGHLTQRADMALQVGDIAVGVEQLRYVEHLARTGVVVEIIVRENLHQFHKIRHVECQFLLCAVHPCLHRIVGMEECRLVDIGIDDLIGGDQVAACQQQCRHHHGKISQFHFLWQCLVN